jgi:nifR3 family TIM-barrel protein
MLQIGSVSLASNLLLAPIAGYCDLAFRLVVRSVPGYAGHPAVGLACTDLLCPHAVLNESDKTLWLAATCEDDQPLAMQLYGRHPEVLAQAGLWAQAQGATLIDINMGCPVDKITKKNGGSMLLCEPTLAVDIARALVRAVRVPVTCKIRLGWDDRAIITHTLPRALADAGVAAITVHGRTTEQKFRGDCRLEGIAQAVETVKNTHPHVAVIGNGDVRCPQDAQRMLNVTGCDGVMIGRGALGQPWIFRDTAYFLATGHQAPSLTRPEKIAVVRQHFERVLHFRGERIALNTLRQRISWYSAQLQPWPGLRRTVQALDSAQGFFDYFDQEIARAAGGVAVPA